MEGFINGKTLALVLGAASSVVVKVTSRVCEPSVGGSLSSTFALLVTYLAILQLQNQLNILPFLLLLFDLGANPSIGGIRLPDPRADLVQLRLRHDVFSPTCAAGS
jgi:hypothetical protein